jgi:hypothetical protein
MAGKGSSKGGVVMLSRRAGVFMAWTGLVAWSWLAAADLLRAREEAKPAALPADLAAIPSDGALVLSVRVADLLGSEFGKPVRVKLARELQDGDRSFQRAFGVSLEHVERLSMVFLDFPPREPLLFLHTTQPYEPGKTILAAGKNVKTEKLQERTFYVGSDHAVLPLDGRSVVHGDVAEIRSLITHKKPAQEGGLAVALREAAGKHALTAGLNVKPLHDAIAGMLPAEAEPFKPLLQARWATLTTDLEESARADLRAAFRAEADAREGLQSLNAAIVLARMALTQGIKQMSQEKDTDKIVAQLKQVQQSLLTAKVEQNGKTLQATANLKIEDNTLGVAALEAIQKVRSSATRVQDTNDLRQLALAMHNYADVNGHFPPHAVYSKDGKPLLSWRVLLLPYIEQNALYKEFHLDEPWDSEHNKKLIAKMPRLYAGPDEHAIKAHETFYQVFTGKGSVFDGKKGIRLQDIPDGTSNTLLIVEASESVPWTKPADIAYDPAKQPLPRLGHMVENGFVAAFCDGSVRFITRKIKPATLRNLIIRNDGNVIDFNDF